MYVTNVTEIQFNLIKKTISLDMLLKTTSTDQYKSCAINCLLAKFLINHLINCFYNLCSSDNYCKQYVFKSS